MSRRHEIRWRVRETRSMEVTNDFINLVRPERSPLHDVRQHAQRNRAHDGHSYAREFVFYGRIQKRIRRARSLVADQSGVAAKAGGARRNRTDDLLLAKQALSQLSYGPAPAIDNLGAQQRREWWAWEDLNFRPHAYQARALTN